MVDAVVRRIAIVMIEGYNKARGRPQLKFVVRKNLLFLDMEHDALHRAQWRNGFI